MADRKKMTTEELATIVKNELSSAVSLTSSELSQQRAKAMDYYYGRQTGDLAKLPGQSGVVSTDVMDTIEWILPSLMRIFASGDEVVKFEPNGPEDEEASKQATDYANWVFNRDNPGFLIQYTMFKDALLQKNGITKIWWEDTEKTEEHPLPAPLAPEEVEPFKASLAEGDELQLQEPDDVTGARSGVVITKVRRGKVRIMNVPPEEFVISRRAKSIEGASFCAHRQRRTKSALIAEGYDRTQVEALSGDEATIQDTSQEAIARAGFDDQATASTTERETAVQEVWFSECYITADFDGDGIAELRKVVMAADEILKLDGELQNEKWETGSAPFASITPIILPHRFYGMSVADLVMDLQLIKSIVMREILNNLYLTTKPRHAISDKVNLDDYLTVRPGGAVRLRDGAKPGDGHVLPLIVPFTADKAFPILEYLDGVRENRTGVTRYNQGVDADSLNKTAHGINQIMSAAAQRVELIARVFAETGVKDMFRQILRCVVKYQDFERAVRLRNEQWQKMDPRQWDSEYDLVTTVGLGTGSKEMILVHLESVLQKQVTALQLQGGANGPIVTLPNIYQTLSRIVENAGLRPASAYFTDPSAPPKEGAAPPPGADQPKPPSPEEMKAQGEMMMQQHKNQMEMGQQQHDQQMAQATAAADNARKDAQVQLDHEAEMARLTMEAEKQRAATEAAANKQQLDAEMVQREADLKRDQAFRQIEANIEIGRAKIEADLALGRERLDKEMELKREEIRLKTASSSQS